MSFNLSFIAVETPSKAEALKRLGFMEAGEAGSEFSAPYAFATLAGGWMVLTATDRVADFALDEALSWASAGGVAIGAEINETVMFSRAAGFRRGKREWTIVHDAGKDRSGLAVDGEPPLQLAAIRQRLEAEEAVGKGEIDYLFDVPIELAASLCGYRPGEDAGASWSIVRPIEAMGARSPGRRKSLSAAIKAELLPLLRSLDFEVEEGLKGYPARYAIRSRGGLTEQIHLEFKQGDEVYIFLDFAVWQGAAEGKPLIAGRVRRPRERGSLLKRFLNLAKQPSSADPVAGAISEARDEIIALDVFLKGGERRPRIFVEEGSAMHTWPNLPESG